MDTNAYLTHSESSLIFLDENFTLIICLNMLITVWGKSDQYLELHFMNNGTYGRDCTYEFIVTDVWFTLPDAEWFLVWELYIIDFDTPTKFLKTGWEVLKTGA